MDKYCPNCKQTLSKTSFYKDISRKDQLTRICKQCSKNYYRDNKAHYNEYYKKRHQSHQKQILDYSKKYREENPLKVTLAKLKIRCKQKNWDFDLTEEYLETIKVDICPVAKTKLNYKPSFAHDPNRASLDRIDNSKGYVKGNVAWISYRINTNKGDLSIQEILNLAEYVKKEKSYA